MPKDKFKLETYLKLKEREKTDAELGLGRAIEALKAEESQLQNLNNELLRMEQERIAKRQEYAEKQMAGAMNAQSMMAAQTWMKKLEEREDIQKRSIENQQKEVTRHETLVEIARETLAKSAAEVKAIEKSKEKWEEQRKREAQSKAEAAMDEITQALFQRRKEQ